MVTGSTGMVGAHTAAALQRAGHELRLLVRDPSRIPRALDPLGVSTPQYVIGSVTDPAAVAEAFRGCDAAVHAAALLSFDRARDAEMQRTNVEGSRLVLETGVRLGLDPIVYVSSLAALFPAEGSLLTAEESVKSPKDLYARSKAAGERVARALQARRAPVVITYPGGVFGPDDPTVNDGVRLIVKFLTSGAFPVTSGGISFIDVRDIAAVHAAVMKPGLGPRRYVLGGHFLPYADLVDCFVRVTGRRVVKLPVPGGLMRGLGWLGDRLRGLGLDVGALTYESMLMATRGVPCDDSPARRELGIAFRTADDTLRDVLQWMYREGTLGADDLGVLARDTGSDLRAESFRSGSRP